MYHHRHDLFVCAGCSVSASSKTGDSVVSAVPEVKSCALEGDDLFFLVGCDGVWDVLSDQEAVDIASVRPPAAHIEPLVNIYPA